MDFFHEHIGDEAGIGSAGLGVVGAFEGERFAFIGESAFEGAEDAGLVWDVVAVQEALERIGVCGGVEADEQDGFDGLESGVLREGEPDAAGDSPGIFGVGGVV